MWTHSRFGSILEMILAKNYYVAFEFVVVGYLVQNTPISYLVKSEQEAQLSQRDRAMLRVIEYFSKSL